MSTDIYLYNDGYVRMDDPTCNTEKLKVFVYIEHSEHSEHSRITRIIYDMQSFDKCKITKEHVPIDMASIDYVILSHHTHLTDAMRFFPNATIISWNKRIICTRKGQCQTSIPFYRCNYDRIKLPTYECLDVITLVKMNDHVGIMVCDILFVPGIISSSDLYCEYSHGTIIEDLFNINKSQFLLRNVLYDVHNKGNVDIVPLCCSNTYYSLNNEQRRKLNNNCNNTCSKTKNYDMTVLLINIQDNIRKSVIDQFRSDGYKIITLNDQPSNLDILNIKSLNDILKNEKIVSVVHFGYTYNELLIQTNYDKNIKNVKISLRAAIDNNCKRFIFVSSSDVYINNWYHEEFKISENWPINSNFLDKYKKNMLFAEHEVKKILCATQIKTIILRVPNFDITDNCVKGFSFSQMICTIFKYIKSNIVSYDIYFGNVYFSTITPSFLGRSIIAFLRSETSGGIYNVAQQKTHNKSFIKPSNNTFSKYKLIDLSGRLIKTIILLILHIINIATFGYINHIHYFLLTAHSCVLDITKANKILIE